MTAPKVTAELADWIVGFEPSAIPADGPSGRREDLRQLGRLRGRRRPA